MNIAIVGTGYVGLVSGTCFAEMGATVTCVDVDANKISKLNNGEMPIYEPGLEELVKRNVEYGRLMFTTDLPSVLDNVEVVFSAVGTPPDEDGSAEICIGRSQTIRPKHQQIHYFSNKIHSTCRYCQESESCNSGRAG